MSRFTDFRTRAKANSNKIWSWLIGIGLVLFAIHNPNQPLLEYAFLPVVGLAISLLSAFFVLSDNWRHLDFGSKWLWIPLACVGLSIAVSGFVNGSGWGERVAPLLFAIYLFGIYLAARILRDDLFAPFSFAVILAAIGCVVYGIMHPGQLTGGFVSPTNYDIAAGLLVFGVVVGVWRWRWWLSVVALVGLFFTGAPEGIIGVGILFLAVLIRKDWGRRILLPIGIILIVAIAWFGLGYGQKLYAYTAWNVTGGVLPTKPEASPSKTQRYFSPYPQLVYRCDVIEERMSDVGPFGHGYEVTHFTDYTVHNIPAVAVDQVGPLAGVAWLFVTIYCLVKTKWKYAWTAVIALSLVDHYLWTQVAPWWWALAGASTASVVKSDLIFRKEV
jgi:hypothetical protein